MKKSFAVRLSLRFMFILTTAIILLSIAFLYCVRYLIQLNQTEQLKQSETKIFNELSEKLQSSDFQSEAAEIYLIASELPYYQTYIAYDAETETVLATNDPFLPLLSETNGKSVHYFEKDFFFDGDLDILYYAAAYKIAGKNIVIAVAENIENDSFSKLFPQLPSALLLMVIPILVLSFLFSFLLTKNTIKPVVKITRAAQNMTTVNLEWKLSFKKHGDEIDELSNTFNDLFARIKSDFERERQFSSDVSHELNTPLTVISGQANLLLRWGKDNPEQLEKSLNAIKNETKSMHAIIENLLQISRIESGRIKPEISEVQVKDIFERVEHEFNAVAPDVRFIINYANQNGEKFLLKTDPEMLHQIITIFVSNSVKFSAGKCAVQLGVQKTEDGKLVLYESDDGPGILEEALPHVFERFYRADEAHTRSAGGSGLGLAIAKTLAEALSAEISAENVEPHGARFNIYF